MKKKTVKLAERERERVYHFILVFPLKLKLFVNVVYLNPRLRNELVSIYE